jgi:hypothetical protein
MARESKPTQSRSRPLRLAGAVALVCATGTATVLSTAADASRALRGRTTTGATVTGKAPTRPAAPIAPTTPSTPGVTTTRRLATAPSRTARGRELRGRESGGRESPRGARETGKAGETGGTASGAGVPTRPGRAGIREREGGRHREGARRTSPRGGSRVLRRGRVTSPSPTPVVVPVVVTSTPVAAAPTATVAVATPASRPATHPVANKRRAARSRARSRRAASSGLPAGVAIAPLAALPVPVEAAKHTTAKRATPGATLSASPIVRTFTKIVNVVPAPIRWVIAVLMLLVLASAVRSRLTARRARRLEVQRKHLLADVGLLQAALLPEPPARLGPVGTSAAYRPAEGPGAGGDF